MLYKFFIVIFLIFFFSPDLAQADVEALKNTFIAASDPNIFKRTYTKNLFDIFKNAPDDSYIIKIADNMNGIWTPRIQHHFYVMLAHYKPKNDTTFWNTLLDCNDTTVPILTYMAIRDKKNIPGSMINWDRTARSWVEQMQYYLTWGSVKQKTSPPEWKKHISDTNPLLRMSVVKSLQHTKLLENDLNLILDLVPDNFYGFKDAVSKMIKTDTEWYIPHLITYYINNSPHVSHIERWIVNNIINISYPLKDFQLDLIRNAARDHTNIVLIEAKKEKMNNKQILSELLKKDPTSKKN